MGLNLGEIGDYFDPGLTLTVKGREYTVPLASAELGLWCRTIASVAGEVSDASTSDEVVAAGERARARAEGLPPLDPDLSFEEQMLGAVHAEMLADQVKDPYIHFAAETAYIWIIGGESAAERYWTSGGRRPEASSPANRQERRAATKPKASASRTTSTGRASTTRSPVSGNTTKSPRTSAKPATAKAPRGGRSSATGA